LENNYSHKLQIREEKGESGGSYDLVCCEVRSLAEDMYEKEAKLSQRPQQEEKKKGFASFYRKKSRGGGHKIFASKNREGRTIRKKAAKR